MGERARVEVGRDMSVISEEDMGEINSHLQRNETEEKSEIRKDIIKR